MSNRPGQLPGLVIFVVNARFIPAERHQPFIYGVVQHVMHSADVLVRAGVRVGLLLYQRDESLNAPAVRRSTVWNTFPAATFGFHFRMNPSLLTAGFEHALACVAGEPTAPWAARRTLVYFQTSALLPFLPGGTDAIVTHHSPFVDDVAAALGANAARRAFDWDHAKADHLLGTQRDGMCTLKLDEAIVCAEISPIQTAYLRAQNIQPGRVLALAQPLQPVRSDHEALGPDGERGLETLLAAPGQAPIAFTAVSRLDYFKNIDLFVDGCCQALQRGAIGGALVVGGPPDDPERQRLKATVPEPLRGAIRFLAKVPHAALVGSLFPRLKQRGVFVCSSRYDLVPYTVLEAARQGVCTLVPSSGHVGASAYIPGEYHFRPDTDGLCVALERLAAREERGAAFAAVTEAVKQSTSDASHLSGFEAAYSRIALSRVGTLVRGA